MADGGDHFGGEDGGQDVCSLLSSFISQRQSVQRLLNWLRESQTTCTDTNCFDDINGLPGTELGNPLNSDGSSQYDDSPSSLDTFVLVLFFFTLLLSLLGGYLTGGRSRNNSAGAAERSADGKGRRDHDGGDDDNSRPAI